jgi:hypothetical protein
METLKKLKWGKVAALTQDGQKYSDYISELQVCNYLQAFISLSPYGKTCTFHSPALCMWVKNVFSCSIALLS